MQHNITTVYIKTLTNGRDAFDRKLIPSQTDSTEQRFSEYIICKHDEQYDSRLSHLDTE